MDTAVSGAPYKKNKIVVMKSEGVCTRTRMLIKENFALAVQQGPRTTRGIEAFCSSILDQNCLVRVT